MVQKKRINYFSKKNYELVGIEVPIQYNLDNNIKFIGYMDVVTMITLEIDIR